MNDGDHDGSGPPDDQADEFAGWYEPDELASMDEWNGPRGDGGDEAGLSAPSKVALWSRRTAMGAVMSGLALGLREVFEPKEQAAIVVEVDDDGEPHDLPVELLLDPDDPRGSLALVRRSHFKPPEV